MSECDKCFGTGVVADSRMTKDEAYKLTIAAIREHDYFKDAKFIPEHNEYSHSLVLNILVSEEVFGVNHLVHLVEKAVSLVPEEVQMQFLIVVPVSTVSRFIERLEITGIAEIEDGGV